MDLKNYIIEYVSGGRTNNRKKQSDFRLLSYDTSFSEFTDMIHYNGYTEIKKKEVSIHPGAFGEKVYHICSLRYIDSDIQIEILNPDNPDYTFTVFFKNSDKSISRVRKYKFERFLKNKTLEANESNIEELIDYLS